MRAFFYRFGKLIWRFMVIFSFIVNIILLLVLLVLGLLIFDIKNNIATPLIAGLHSSFVGLDKATIDWTIPVGFTLPLDLPVPINANTITSQVTQIGGVPVSPIAGETVVRLTRDVPIRITGANIVAPGLTLSGATVNISLPAGTELPVALDLAIRVVTEVPISTDVRAVIPLNQTQLHDVAENLRLLFEPLARIMTNLPNDFGGAAQMVSNVLAGQQQNLLAENAYTANPWPGFSRTAGFGYSLYGVPVPASSQPIDTGIVPIGGIPALDAQLPDRSHLYQNGSTPEQVNLQAINQINSQTVIAPEFYNGGVSEVYLNAQNPTSDSQAIPPTNEEPNTEAPPTSNDAGQETVPPSGGDLGILPTPQPGG
jgi:hypothetical protein